MKDVADATTQDKGKAVEATEKKAQFSEKSQLLEEKRSAEVQTKLGKIELKLAQAERLNLAHAEEVEKLNVALEVCENKWYNKGFADAKNFVEPVVHQAQVQGFKEGWLAAFQALEVPADSPLRNLEQIPHPVLATPVQSQVEATDDEDTSSMRELVEAIGTHMESMDLEITNNFNALGNKGTQQPPTKDVLNQLADDVVQFYPTNPAA